MTMSDEITNLLKYIQQVKPYHTKILDTVVEYNIPAERYTLVVGEHIEHIFDGVDTGVEA